MKMIPFDVPVLPRHPLLSIYLGHTSITRESEHVMNTVCDCLLLR
jgi:hypothetical protein